MSDLPLERLRNEYVLDAYRHLLVEKGYTRLHIHADLGDVATDFSSCIFGIDASGEKVMICWYNRRPDPIFMLLNTAVQLFSQVWFPHYSVSEEFQFENGYGLAFRLKLPEKVVRHEIMILLPNDILHFMQSQLTDCKFDERMLFPGASLEEDRLVVYMDDWFRRINE
jgi:hypothetical protein